MSEAASSAADPPPLKFYSVAETADILGVSEMTLYRLIRGNAFPAIRVGSRLVVPARCLEEMVDTAFKTNSVVDPADWASATSP